MIPPFSLYMYMRFITINYNHVCHQYVEENNLYKNFSIFCIIHPAS
jgi:hypothetical protein